MKIEKETTGNEMLLERIFKALEVKEKTYRQDLAKMRAITKMKAGE